MLFRKGSSVLIPMFTLTVDTPGSVWIEMSYIHISTHEPCLMSRVIVFKVWA